ncbi:carbohydrate kinase [Fulvimarina sp. 2208YS6-2-32]|uniref:Carbohydrate kinase n=1 Tax=Fulvimarina uroteuthidis TaxID=3098149 RepID=A0ABU5I6L0_9HYPH|nr:carbohydrate kinase [Fulvimarina sp. 2208YS6-2-32]MDY8110553.1 carbohydrate kinase [Fulvimarina sp. 2208YS6-2-32]
MYLSCGDSLFDLFGIEESDDVAAIGLSGRVGGSPLNVALGIARLGHPAGFFTKISSDLFGRKLAAFMDQEKIDRRYSIPTDRHTTLAIVSLDETGTAVYDFYIDGTADRSIETHELPGELSDVVGLHLASYATVTEPTASTLIALAKRESTTKFISYDPNIRLSIEPDVGIWRDKVREIVPMATLVKASEEDLDMLYPGRPIEEVQADWLEQGAEIVVITLGGKGAKAATRSGIRAFEDSQRITVVDTVGAGDTFQAGLIVWLMEKDRLSREGLSRCTSEEIHAMLRFAMKAAAITCSRQGADLPRRSDLGLDVLA